MQKQGGFKVDLKGKQSEFLRTSKQLKQLQDKTLPVKAGALAVNFFRDNFRKGGYQDNGLTAWKKTKRQLSGAKSAAANYGPLLSGRNHLMNSVRYTTTPGVVVIRNDVVYAAIHNNGGILSHRLTPRMRAFAWVHYFQTAGIRKGMNPRAKKAKEDNASEEAKMWKGIALSKKTVLRQVIPQRQFMGRSGELVGKINNMAAAELKKIFDNK
jgi:phage gpG-like protein